MGTNKGGSKMPLLGEQLPSKVANERLLDLFSSHPGGIESPVHSLGDVLLQCRVLPFAEVGMLQMNEVWMTLSNEPGAMPTQNEDSSVER